MQINGHAVQNVLVVDDSPYVREAYAFALEELHVNAIFESGPLGEIAMAVQALRRKADALVCDYHLRKRNYSVFDGDLFVAESYKSGVPALLCTTYNDFDITVMRTKRRFIPGLVKADDLNPNNIVKAFTRCIAEHKGDFDPSRKPWRTLVRIEEAFSDQDYCYVVIPGWNPEQKIRLLLEDLPAKLRQNPEAGTRVHALVNIGAQKPEEIYFDEWEAA
jgi:CheY-like chemotaxis protein